MKTVLKLDNPLWKTPSRRRILSRVVQQSAAELEGEIKQKILTGTKSGRLYRRGSITRAASKKNLALGLRRVKGNPNRVFAGANFHRASAPGESPANDLGGLENSVRARSTGEMKAKVAAGVKYAAALDAGTTTAGKNHNITIAPRPFFETTAEEFKVKFKQNFADALESEK